MLKDCKYLITIEGLGKYVEMSHCNQLQRNFRDLVIFHLDVLKPVNNEKQRTEQIQRLLSHNF